MRPYLHRCTGRRSTPPGGGPLGEVLAEEELVALAQVGGDGGAVGLDGGGEGCGAAAGGGRARGGQLADDCADDALSVGDVAVEVGDDHLDGDGLLTLVPNVVVGDAGDHGV